MPNLAARRIHGQPEEILSNPLVEHTFRAWGVIFRPSSQPIPNSSVYRYVIY